jgi:hypothetical protein
MVGATAIDLTAFVCSRILNLFVRFVRFVVKHPVSGPHAIGSIRVSDTHDLRDPRETSLGTPTARSIMSNSQRRPW